MKVLHIIFDNNLRSPVNSLKNITMLTSTTLTHRVITDQAVDLPEEQLISIALKQWNTISICNKFLNILFTEMPDIVHIHSCWNHNAAQCLRMAKRRGFVTFFSPYRDLQPTVMKIHFWTDKVWKWLWFQRKMLKQADYIFAQDEKEMMELYNLGRLQNIALINVLASRSEETTTKIVNTYISACEEKDARQLSIGLLRIIHKQLNLLIQGERPYSVTLPEHEQRQYNIFCHRQGLDKIMKEFCIKKYDSTEILDILLKSIKDFRRNLNRHKATFAEVFTIVAMMQNNDYDEDLLCGRLTKNKNMMFTRRIIAIADELCGVIPGFMPALPLKDATTEKMKLQILNRKNDN